MYSRGQLEKWVIKKFGHGLVVSTGFTLQMSNGRKKNRQKRTIARESQAIIISWSCS